MEIFLNWDFAVLDAIQGIRTAWLDALMSGITHLGDGGIFWIATGLVLCLYKKYRPYGLMVLAALFGGLLAGNLGVKPAVARLRPFQVREGIALLIREPGEFSFPSGHTLSSFEAAFVLFYMDRRIGIGALFLAALIAFSRLYLFVHYPTDVLGGFLLAGVIAGAVIQVARRFFGIGRLGEEAAGGIKNK